MKENGFPCMGAGNGWEQSSVGPRAKGNWAWLPNWSQDMKKTVEQLCRWTHSFQRCPSLKSNMWAECHCPEAAMWTRVVVTQWYLGALGLETGDFMSWQYMGLLSFGKTKVEKLSKEPREYMEDMPGCLLTICLLLHLINKSQLSLGYQCA